MTNWSSLSRFPTIEELKELPILWVLEQAGVEYEEVGGVYKALSPFRPDNTPSFDVYADDEGKYTRWGDYAEGTSGDVLDLVQRFLDQAGQPTSIQNVKDETARLLGLFRSSGWVAPAPVERKTFDLEAARQYVESATADPEASADGVSRLLSYRQDRLSEVDPGWLVGTFRLGFDGDRVLIPYLDRSGTLQVYKTRRPGQPVFSAAGSSHQILYGEWLDDGSSTVVLCEGESDVWSGTAAGLRGYVFLGLPTGAGAAPKQAYRLAGRRVILAFDGDPAGRQGTAKWSGALLGLDSPAEVLVASVSDGMDISMYSKDGLESLLKNARAHRPRPQDAHGVLPGDAGYVRNGRNAEQISDWVFHPKRQLFSPEGAVWSGTLQPFGTHAVIKSSDLSTKASVIRWAQKHDVSWFGTDKDVQLLKAALHADSVLLPSGTAVETAGLHDNVFVFPGGKIGEADFEYVPGKIEVPLSSTVKLPESGQGIPVPGLPLGLRDLHVRSVMDPILAWLAIAPLRSKLERFPILAVTGASGSGKTTLVRETVRHFTATEITANLTGTTKFAMLGYASSTNAFPVWFDEYRPGARKETLAEFNQLLRDAYTGQPSIKGGMGDWSVVREIATHSPIIVSGEDAFSETSHTERMVTVHLPREGKNTDLMPDLETADISRFAWDYLDWVRNQALPSVVPEGPEGLPSRNRYNLGVLRAGWNLLRQWLWQYNLDFDGDPDWSLVIGEAIEAAGSSPILDALQWAREDDRLRLDHVVFEDDEGFLHVRVDAFVAAANKSGVFTLPGGSKAVAKYLQSQLGATAQRVRLRSAAGEGPRLRTWSFPVEMLP